jgi:DNA-binding CsgD family transcriptional regulator
MSEPITVSPDRLPPYQASTPPEVAIRVASDQDAARITAVLEALGYAVTRDWETGPASHLATASVRVAQRHKLTAREREILDHVLVGASNEQISRALELSRATVKWHMHNIFAKTNTGTREALLRLVLQLPQI